MDTPDSLFSRNWAYISSALQERLAATCLLIAGTGLGAVAALQAARTGFGRFILADGDRVERSNLNRQPFDHSQIGQNKAEATAEMIRRINPDARLQILPRFLKQGDFEEPLRDCDLALNTIDFENHAFIHCNQAARREKRTVLFPLNIGWGGALYILSPFADPDTPQARWLLETRLSPIELKRKLILNAVAASGQMKPYLRNLLDRFLDDKKKNWPYDPQLAVGAAITSALIVHAAVALVAGEKLPHVPEVIYVDLARAEEE